MADPLSYQELLRAMGAMLDADHAGRISIVEVDDGFVLRRQHFRYPSVDLAVSHITRDALQEHGLKLQQARPHSRAAHHPGLWGSFQHTHQDFFRSLGYELDVVGARHLMVDELSDGLLLCYQQAAHEEHLPGMRRVVLTTSEIQEIFNEATRRRRTSGQSRVSQQLGSGVSEAGGSAVEQQGTAWAPVREGVPYQQVLRAVGAALDERGAEGVCVLEAPDGLAVRYHTRNDGRARLARFRDEQLQVDGPALRQESGGRYPPKPTEPGGYQDLLRALGYELERKHASGVLLSEWGDGFTITYQYLDPRQSLTPLKAMVVMGRSEQAELQQSARARRQPEPQPSLLGRWARRQRA